MEIKLPFTVQKEIAQENLDGSNSSARIGSTWGMGALAGMLRNHTSAPNTDFSVFKACLEPVARDLYALGSKLTPKVRCPSAQLSLIPIGSTF